MARGPRPTLGQAVQLAQLVSIVANINWKGLKPFMDKLKSWFSALNPSKIYGRLIIGLLCAALVSFVLYDWRRNAVEAVEARAKVAEVTAERDTLAIQVARTDAATAERQRLIAALTEEQGEKLEDLSAEIVASGNSCATAVIPDAIRNRMR